MQLLYIYFFSNKRKDWKKKIEKQKEELECEKFFITSTRQTILC